MRPRYRTRSRDEERYLDSIHDARGNVGLLVGRTTTHWTAFGCSDDRGPTQAEDTSRQLGRRHTRGRRSGTPALSSEAEAAPRARSKRGERDGEVRQREEGSGAKPDALLRPILPQCLTDSLPEPQLPRHRPPAALPRHLRRILPPAHADHHATIRLLRHVLRQHIVQKAHTRSSSDRAPCRWRRRGKAVSRRGLRYSRKRRLALAGSSYLVRDHGR